MRINIIAVGSLGEKFYTQAEKEYVKRLKRFAKIDIVELKEERPNSQATEDIRRALEVEGDRIRKNIPKNSYTIVLAIEGKKMDSISFSKLIEKEANQGISNFCFIIGGSNGLSSSIKRDADFLLSFSDMTFPHGLMRIILLEQVFRAMKIKNKEKYHK